MDVPAPHVEGGEEGLYGGGLLGVGGGGGAEGTVGIEAGGIPALDALVTPGGDARDDHEVELADVGAGGGLEEEDRALDWDWR